MVVPSIAMAATSHSFTYEFKSYVWSKVYSIDNGNDTVTISTKLQQYSGEGDSDLRVTAFYRTWAGDKSLGTKTYKLFAPDSKTWKNTDGNGKYLFLLQKDNDGQLVTGSGTIK